MYELGAPQNKKVIVTDNGLNKDIITAIHTALPAAQKEVRYFAPKFKGATNLDTANNIWRYLRTLKYIKDPAGYQFIKLPKKLTSSSGDCKSFSLLTAAILQENKLPVKFRYASYDKNDSTPSHVYTVTEDEKGQDIIIDGVYTKFNKEVPYKHKKDYKMQIAVINGIDKKKLGLKVKEAMQEAKREQAMQQQETSNNTSQLNTSQASNPNAIPKKTSFNPQQLKTEFLKKALTKVKPAGFLFNLISNELRRINNQPANIIYSPEQLQKYLQRLKNRKSLIASDNWISKIIQNEINAIELNRFTGLIKFAHTDKELSGIEEEIGKLNLKKITKKISLKNIVKGVKKIGLVVPRKAFLSLVFLNVRGLAKRLSKLPEAKLEKLWVKTFGGKLSSIKKAIAKGKNKKALFGASKKVKQIKGIGYAVYCNDATTIHGIGATITEGSSSNSSGAAAGAAAAAATAAATAAAANPAGAASVATILAAAAPIIAVIVKALKSEGIPEESNPLGTEGEPTDFSDTKTDAETGTSNFEKYATLATNLAESAGIIPSRSNTPTEEAVNNALPAGDTDAAEDAAAGEEDTAGADKKMLLPLLIGGAAALYFITKKKSKK
jgi:hypothetical protein